MPRQDVPVILSRLYRKRTRLQDKYSELEKELNKTFDELQSVDIEIEQLEEVMENDY